MSSLSVVPAYGRDYKSKAAVIEALKSNEDFKISDMSSQWDGKPGNLTDFKREGITSLTVRYGKLMKVTVVDVTKL